LNLVIKKGKVRETGSRRKRKNSKRRQETNLLLLRLKKLVMCLEYFTRPLFIELKTNDSLQIMKTKKHVKKNRVATATPTLASNGQEVYQQAPAERREERVEVGVREVEAGTHDGCGAVSEKMNFG